jgi:hypothetical protein
MVSQDLEQVVWHQDDQLNCGNVPLQLQRHLLSPHCWLISVLDSKDTDVLF